MKKIVSIALVMILPACGGGGVDQNTYVAPDSTVSQPGTNINSTVTAIDVPQDFDFENFRSASLSFVIPNDLVGQVDFKIAGEWDGKVQDLYIGRGYPGQQRSVDIYIPSAIDAVRIEYLVFDKQSQAFQVAFETKAI